MSEEKKPDPKAEDAKSKPESTGEKYPDWLLVGDELPIEYLPRFQASPSIIPMLKRNGINTFGDFRQWKEDDINKRMQGTIPLRALAVQARKIIGDKSMKPAHEALQDTMKLINEKKKSDTEKRKKK